MNFTDVSEQAKREHPDLILLDIGLPGKDGFSLCASLKSSVDVPVPILSTWPVKWSRELWRA